MRKLTSKQKKLLDKWCIENDNKVGLFFKPEHLPNDLYEELEEINDTEILYQNIERYVHDKI